MPRWARLFHDYPAAIAAAVALAERCTFSLDELRYTYAADPAPAGMTQDAYLAQLVRAGAKTRYPDKVPKKNLYPDRA